MYSFIKAKIQIISNVKCTISAGIFSTEGAKDIEAQEIHGNIIYGNKIVLEKKQDVLKRIIIGGEEKYITKEQYDNLKFV